ncbi:hypothetical protein Hypma_006537 [Hypsizygus marmoreus]|uniref:Uncharacterized protein n=1 Tax=Hypsizygus marmoreus TaxID=39966 RepID=A0A369JZN4_HYPMA|nr:hypothetical protein Hypma_006537 [Hypsizygus marmoreus]
MCSSFRRPCNQEYRPCQDEWSKTRDTRRPRLKTQAEGGDPEIKAPCVHCCYRMKGYHAVLPGKSAKHSNAETAVGHLVNVPEWSAKKIIDYVQFLLGGRRPVFRYASPVALYNPLLSFIHFLLGLALHSCYKQLKFCNVMFAKIAVQLISLTVLATGVLAGPVALRPDYSLAVRGNNWRSFNNWGGHASLGNFDNFHGIDNFDGSHFSQVVVKQERELVCRTQRVEIIQQQLIILQEMAKRIVTEQICEVETQTIVFEQWHSGLHGFSRDLRRHTGHQVGFDRNIVKHFNSIINVDGSFNTHDFGFTGHDIGRETVVVSGHNWDDTRSRVTVEDAYRASRDAYRSVHPDLL